MSTRIVATGSYLPPNSIANADLKQFPAAALGLIEQKTGVKARCHAGPGECSSDLAVKAARQCIEAAGVDPSTIDGIILSTSSPDRIQPATATRVQDLLGARNAFAFDINSVCSGAVFGLCVADNMIKAGQCSTILVVAAEVYSRILDPGDFSTFPYFGDGAGAVLLAADSGSSGIRRTILRTDGSGAEVIQIPAGGTMKPIGPETTQRERSFTMNGRRVFDFAISAGQAVVKELLAAVAVKPEEIAFLVPHQANKNILSALATGLGLPLEKVVSNLERYGNTASASVLIAFDELVRSGRLKRGDRLVLVSFGGGLSWGANLIEW